jgi:hypothetical protein
VNKKYKIILISLLVLGIGIAWWFENYYAISHDWDSRTYHHDDNQPYGCLVFDSVMLSSCPHGYSHTYLSISQLQDSLGHHRATTYLLLNPSHKYLTNNVVDTMFRLARQGAAFFIATDNVFLTDIFKKKLTKLKSLSIPNKKAGSNWRSKYGKGSIILASSPQDFSNYGILHDSIGPLVAQQLGYIMRQNIIRTEYYNDYYQQIAGSKTGQSADQMSLLYVIMQHKSTRWAFFVALVGIALYMIFSSFRLQRAIPIIAPPRNQIMHFVRSIAGLYLQKNSNANILLKKRLYWSDRLQRESGINLAAFERNGEVCKVLAEKAKRSPAYVQKFLTRLYAVCEADTLSDEDLIEFVKKMEEFS